MEHITELFDNRSEYINQFTKKGYPVAFAEYQKQVMIFFSECDEIYKSNQDKNLICKKAAEEICETAVEMKKQQVFKSRMQEVTWMQELNLFIVAYIFPSILECRNDYYKELCETIEKSWAKTFRGNKIKAATFETLNSGFKKKAFGLF